MSKESDDVTAARIEAERARAQMMQTAQILQAKLKPSTLAQNAWEGAKVKGADLAEDAVDAVRKRPLAATGVAAAVALFLAREPLKDLAGKIWSRDDDDEELDQDGESQIVITEIEYGK